jgi:hypothetical protein
MLTKRTVAWLFMGIVVVAVAATAAPARAQLDQLLKGIRNIIPGGGLTDAKIGDGLKEALQVGTQNAVDFTGKQDGYFLNQAIKVMMPDNLQTLEKGLRAVGYGPKVDEFILSMNRAAERAAPEAKQIFWDAIGEMTFEDARKILDGPETAATDYFKGRTTDKLAAAFRPVIERVMNEVGVTRQYKELLGRAQAIPFLKLDKFDLDQYVVGKALDGLFHVVASEEKKIRRNPAARTTTLLKEVFAK